LGSGLLLLSQPNELIFYKGLLRSIRGYKRLENELAIITVFSGTYIMNESYWQTKVDILCDKKGEDNEVDFKKNVSEDTDRLKEHINAMANNQSGGIFVFGIDKDFAVSSALPDNDKIEKHLTSLARDTQEPALTVQIHHLTRNGSKIVGVEILSPETRPVFIKDRAPFGGSG
jgi:hypothetical protein